jgi:glycine/D-amino acid oxidase-like deaminating enzyme
MTIDYLLIGQGLCGTFLSYELEKAGRSFIVIDEANPLSASRVASGIINPVTGRRIVKTWMIDQLLPFAADTYKHLEEKLDVRCCEQTSITDFFPTPQMRLAFLERFTEHSEYLSIPGNESSWSEVFRYDFGFGNISPCLLVDLAGLLGRYRQFLQASGWLLDERFRLQDLVVRADGIQYNGITASRVLFCDGISSVENPWFNRLPFAPNKGEALVLDIPELPTRSIFKKGINLVPWKDGLWWAGSSHEWKFEDGQPTQLFRDKTEAQVKSLLKLPFRIEDHLAAVRPATLERRPFCGFHPAYPSIGIFNGMGTKGCSLAPFFARNLVEHVTSGSPLLPEADISRFTNILTRAHSTR